MTQQQALTAGTGPADADREHTGRQQDEYEIFKQRVFTKSGIDLGLYKEQQMRRRLTSLLERSGATGFLDFFHCMEKDPQQYAAFLDHMTINVSELFRNPEKWQELREKVLPPMLAQNRPLRIWSAGCSYGAEPYSLAILMDQLSPGVRHTIHASDLDKNILARAREGRFSLADVRNLDAKTREHYFSALPGSARVPALDTTPTLQVKADLREQVTFRAQNLLADPFEENYDLICCRNVVIYFTEEAKDTLYQRFFRALRPGGLLLVGGTERIFQYESIGFHSPLPFFYRRPIA